MAVTEKLNGSQSVTLIIETADCGPNCDFNQLIGNIEHYLECT